MARPVQAKNEWLVLVFLSLGFFMILLDTTIVNIAIPAMISGLNSSLDQIFFVIVPVGLVALAGALLVVPDLRPGRRHRLDIIGVLLASASLFGIIFGLVEGERFNWGAIWGPITIPEIIAAGVVLFAVFVVFERFQAEPLMPLSLFSNRNFSISIWVSSAVAFGMLGFFIPVTIFFQSVLGFSALKAGLTFLPMSLVSMVVAPIAGRMSDRFGGKYILVAGLTFFAAGMGLVVLVISLNATQATFWGPAALAGLGLGMTFAPLTTVAMRNVKPHMAGAASGVLNTVRQVGVGQTGAQLPVGVPPALAPTLQRLFHDVFDNAYVNAVKPTLAVSIAVLAVGALSCLLLERRAKAPARADAAEAGSRAAAG